jgi:site-specific DNA-methyltransferase (adenine-specific)
MQLLKGDCLEVMKTLPDKSVDLFVCDLPYGCLTMGAKTNPRAFAGPNSKHYIRESGCAWDIPIDLAQFWVEVKRLAKDDHTPVLMFCTTRFGYELIKSNESWFRYDLVWNKMRGVSFLAANKMPMRSHEMVYVFAKKGARYYRKDVPDETKKARKKDTGKQVVSNCYNGGAPLVEGKSLPAGKRCALSVVEAGNNANKQGKHPTQKPDDLYAWLIERYSKPGDTVLDPTAGSFASVFTAERMGRRGIGIEMDEGFFQKAIAASQA